MKILGIETSCDDSAIALLETKKGDSFFVLSNIVSSQIEVHKKYGGVYPALAKREHQKNLVPVLTQALKEAGLLKIKSDIISNSLFSKIKEILEREPLLTTKIISFLKKYQKPKIDLIAITIGPGLEPCLWVGVNFAKALSLAWQTPLVAINHIEAHILINLIKWDLKNKRGIKNPAIKELFPAVCLVASGGHTQLILVKEIGNYKLIGETRDDAAGECFDKCAKILGLNYPGGPEIAKLAKESENQPKFFNLPNFPRPMIHTKDYDFSFSGLKTAVLYYHRKQDKKTQKNPKYISEMAREIQQAIIDILVKKTLKAALDFGARSIILGGGVSANYKLRSQFEEKMKNENLKIKLLFPLQNLSTDNALMTTLTGYFHQKEKLNLKKTNSSFLPPNIKAKAHLKI